MKSNLTFPQIPVRLLKSVKAVQKQSLIIKEHIAVLLSWVRLDVQAYPLLTLLFAHFYTTVKKTNKSLQKISIVVATDIFTISIGYHKHV